jgi:hypothetical protein
MVPEADQYDGAASPPEPCLQFGYFKVVEGRFEDLDAQRTPTVPIGTLVVIERAYAE